MKSFYKRLVGVLLVAVSGVCGPFGSISLNVLLSQADDVVVATVRNSSASAGTLSVELMISRTLKGSAAPGTSIYGSLSSPNVIYPAGSGVRTNGAISPDHLRGTTGLWFLKQSDKGLVVLPLMMGDISGEDLFLPIPNGSLNLAYAYDASADLRIKLLQEIGAAAQDPATAPAVSHLERMRSMVDLGSDQLRPVFSGLVSSTQATSRATGLAGLVRLGTPSALTALVSMDIGNFGAETKIQLVDAICEYRNGDVSGIAALGALLGSQFPDRIRACAAYALREIHTSETVPFLKQLLADNSARIRYDAVIGIAQFAIGFPAASMDGKKAALAGFKPGPAFTSEMYQYYPAIDFFAKNEQLYISYWKTWLGQNAK